MQESFQEKKLIIIFFLILKKNLLFSLGNKILKLIILFF